MHWKEWIYAVLYSFNPLLYKKVSDAPPKEMLLLLRKTLFWAFMAMILLAIPSIVSMPWTLEKTLGDFDALKLTGDISIAQPIAIPEDNPQFVIDFSDGRAYEGERMLLTKGYFYFQTPLNPKKINLNIIKDPLSYKWEFSLILTLIFVLWLPSLLIYTYFVTALKYFLWLALSSLLATMLIRLILLSKMKMRKIVNICAYALIPVMILEVLTLPFNTGWLFPILDFFGFSINLVSILLHAVLACFGLISLEKEIRFEVHDRRERY